MVSLLKSQLHISCKLFFLSFFFLFSEVQDACQDGSFDLSSCGQCKEKKIIGLIVFLIVHIILRLFYRKKANMHTHTHTPHTHAHTYTHTYTDTRNMILHMLEG